MLTEDERAKLDDLQFMLGVDAGSLSLALELITDAMAQVNLHAVYCRATKGPRAGNAPRDVAEALATMQKVKDLVQSTLGRLRSQ